MQQLTTAQVKQVSGGKLDGEVLLLAAAGIFGGILGAYYSPMVAPNVTIQIMIVIPLGFTSGALVTMIAAGIVLAVV